MGLPDTGIPDADHAKLTNTLEFLRSQILYYHTLLTRQAGQRKFIEFG